MRLSMLAIAALLLVSAPVADAGRVKKGQARSAEVLAQRQAASPRGAKEWGGTSNRFIRSTQKEVRGLLRAVGVRGGDLESALGKQQAVVTLRDIVTRHMGMTRGEVVFGDRRHDRAVLKELRRIKRQIATARGPSGQLGPAERARMESLERLVTGEIAAITRRHQQAD